MAHIDQVFDAVANNDRSVITDYDHSNPGEIATLRNRSRQTLLHVAAGFGRTQLVLYLIQKGADVNAQDDEGQAPLHNATCHGHYTISSKLIAAGAIVNLTDKCGWTPLHLALARKDNREKISQVYLNVIELLLKSGANPYIKNHKGHACVQLIKNSENRRDVRMMYLVKKLEDHIGSEETRIQLIDEGLSVADYFELVRIGDANLDMLEMLTTPKLLNSHLDSRDSITPLHRAAGYNHLEVAKMFINRGANVNATDSFGRIALHNAAQYGHIEMIDLLVQERSDINKQDLEGYSPLHTAASKKTFAACLKLIELGANVNLRCNLGNLPSDLAQSDSLKLVLKPDEGRNTFKVIPSTSKQAVYIDSSSRLTEPSDYSSLRDMLMLDSSSTERLFPNTSYTIKKQILDVNDKRYREVEKRMLDTIVGHTGESGGRYSTYEIVSIEVILHENVWTKYKLMCQRLEIDYGPGKKNERMLFHGSNFVDNIQTRGFEVGYAQRNGMFGAGIYFAEHSSKSNQYTFGWGQGCRDHNDKSCYICVRKMIYCQVALGRCLITEEAMPDRAHSPPEYSSVAGLPGTTDDLMYPEYCIYSGDQAYPLFVIHYRIKQ